MYPISLTDEKEVGIRDPQQPCYGFSRE